MTRGLVLSLTLIAGSVAFADTSVWENAKREAYQVTGKITSIATNENEILVRIKTDSVTETYKLCSSFPGGDGINLIETERAKSVRDAFNHGDLVIAAYNSPFDRCLVSIEITKEIKKDDRLATSTAKHAVIQRAQPSL